MRCDAFQQQQKQQAYTNYDIVNVLFFYMVTLQFNKVLLLVLAVGGLEKLVQSVKDRVYSKLHHV